MAIAESPCNFFRQASILLRRNICSNSTLPDFHHLYFISNARYCAMDLIFLLRKKANMKAPTRALGAVIIFMLVFGTTASAQPGVSGILKSMIEHADSTHTPIVLFDGVILHNDLFLSFYRPSEYAIAWKRNENIVELIDVIRTVDREGLNPNDYHLQALSEYYARQKTEPEIVFFDLLLTDAFLSYGSHLLFGRLDPEILYPHKWEVTRPEADLVGILQRALFERSVARTLIDLAPKNGGYQKLQAYLQLFRDIKSKGGWQRIPEGPSLEPGIIDDRVPLVRERLNTTRQLPLLYHSPNAVEYDSALLAAVKKFQRQNGLDDDGVIGKSTLQCLNYSVDDYIDKILVNLERYRWLPRNLGNQFLLINIPAYSAVLCEADSIMLSMRAIVGRKDRKTPVFSSVMRNLIYNPTWTVPPTILEEDVLPQIKKDIRYLELHDLRVIDYTGEEISPESIPWASYSASNFPYLLRQDPGTLNPLGLIKFEFINRYRVFLHDTNNHALFNQSYRALSSGCIRIDKPYALAVYLLKGTSWTEETLRQAVSSGETVSLPVQIKIPIHFVYFTAFVDDDGNLQTRNDIYAWDQDVLKAL